MRQLKLTPNLIFSSFNSIRNFTSILYKKPEFITQCSLAVLFSPKSICSHSAYCFQMTSLLSRNPGFPASRLISSSADSISSSENGGGGNLILEEEDESDETFKDPISVRAFFLSTSVDLKTLVEMHKQCYILPSSPMTNYVVLGFGNLKPENGTGANLSGNNCCYVVVFQYGSVVLFSIPDHEVDGYLKIVERHASGFLAEMRKNEYEVREEPTLNTLVQCRSNCIMLQYLNIERIRIIGSVLGQSIALDYYVHRVDAIVVEFSDLNCGMVDTGTIKMEPKMICQIVGRANTNLADIILRLGLFERSDIAWKDAEYAKIWEYLRDEFDLTKRFASLDSKFQFVEHNIHFHKEVLPRQSRFMEWLYSWFH